LGALHRLTGQRRRLLRLVLTAAVLAGAVLAAGSATARVVGPPSKLAPAIPGTQSYRCTGSAVKLFDNSNGQGVQNGGKPAAFTTKGKTYCLASLTTYHWNNGQGMAPGTIGLTVLSGFGGAGNTLGPLAAGGSAGQGGVANANWTATAALPVVLNGTYACQDSDPASWSQNQGSHGGGFCTVTVTNATPVKSPQPAKPTYACIGAQVKLFDNSNGGGVQNGGKTPFFNTYGTVGISAYCLNSITTYHWNNGAGKAPGTIGLGPLSFGAVVNPVGPRQATGSSGQNNAPNVNWTVNYPAGPKPTVISGVYTCKDSDPKTWSANQQSGGNGFCIVYATPAYVNNFVLPSGLHVPSAPPPAPPAPAGVTPISQSHVKCFTGTLSSMLLNPIHVAPDGWVFLLLHCAIPKKDGFQGRLTPSYILAVARGCGPFWTYPFASGNPPPPVFLHYTGQPGAPCSNALTYLPFMVHGPWRVDIQARDATTQAPLRPAAYGIFVRYSGADVQAQNTLNIP
jgi:hypothetical protein